MLAGCSQTRHALDACWWWHFRLLLFDRHVAVRVLLHPCEPRPSRKLLCAGTVTAYIELLAAWQVCCMCLKHEGVMYPYTVMAYWAEPRPAACASCQLTK